ncbi:MAG: hypothetical protein Ct9H300mP13_1090 [Gammaproteobacteria bacterium]|nr:MAG: hypothetical protein Ct9H300mP13_1090 [Gammaproteobacteria bacterium]
MIFNGAGESFRHPPWGFFGGAPGGRGRFLLRTESGESRLEDKPDQVAIGPDDAVVIETPGAGGFKLPADRTAEAVAGDRATGKFSEEYLNRYYGHLTQMTEGRHRWWVITRRLGRIDLRSIWGRLRIMSDRFVNWVWGFKPKIIAALKGDGYGFGLIPVARTVVKHGVDMIAVADISEGASIRLEGIEFRFCSMRAIRLISTRCRRWKHTI